MTDMKTKFFNVLVASVAVAAPALAADQVSTNDGANPSFASKLADRGPGASCGGGACHNGARVKFSDDQLEKMHTLKNQFLDNNASKMTELGSLERQMKDVFTATNIDRSKALDLESKIAAVKADLGKSRLNLKLDTIALLTPEQREAMRHRMLEGGFRGGHHGGHHRFGHGGPGAEHFKGGKPGSHQEKA